MEARSETGRINRIFLSVTTYIFPQVTPFIANLRHQWVSNKTRLSRKPEFCGFLEIGASQIPSTCADVRIVGSNAGGGLLAVRGSWPGTPNLDPGEQAERCLLENGPIGAISFDDLQVSGAGKRIIILGSQCKNPTLHKHGARTRH
jgi:hypothetical protein